MLNSLSASLEIDAPAIALQFNPLNSDARVALAFNELEGRDQPPDESTRRLISNGIALAPIDARFFTLMAQTEQQLGNEERAALLFDHALALLPTELQALIGKLNIALANNDFAEAVDHIEIIGRRWRYWESIETVFPYLLADEDAYTKIVDRFSRDDRLRGELIGVLSKLPDGLPFAYSILLDWHGRAIDGLDPLINQVTAALNREKRYDDAFLLFRLTRGKGNDAQSGYVFNGEFRLPLSGNPFDWKIARQSGVDFLVSGQKRTAKNNVATPLPGQLSSSRSGLVIRFLDNPIRLRNLVQLIRLAPGSYRLSVTYSAHQLKAPEPLQMGISCIDTSETLGKIAFEGGTINPRQVTIDFLISPHECPFQQIFLFNDELPESWKYRYSGTLTLEKVSITPVGV